MRLKMTNRWYQVVSIVLLLMMAVALTAALVVAAEQGSQSSSKAVWYNGRPQTSFLEQPVPMGWV